MGCLDYVPTRTRHPRRDASTTFRLARSSFDKASRLSTNLRLARPQVEPLDPPYSPTLRQKLEHLMRLPTTSYRHGYSCDRRGSSTGVKSHFLLPIPRWEVKICHYTPHTAHCFATDHPRGRIRQGPYPAIPGTQSYPLTLDPSLTRPRPTAGQQGRKADVAQGSESFRRLILYVTMVSRDGRPFPGHVATATSTGVDKTSPQDTPGVPTSSYPIKGQTRALQGEREASQKPSTNKQRQKDNKP
jgi:hypothetical protein